MAPVVGAVTLLVPLILPLPWSSSASASSTGAASSPVTSELVVVGLKSSAVHVATMLGGLSGSTPKLAIGNRYELSVPAGQVGGVLDRLRAEPGVAYAEVSPVVHATVTPNDACYTGICGQPGSPYIVHDPPAADGGDGLPTAATEGNLAEVDAPGAWAVTAGSPSVTVAVLDTGVDATHPDLAGKVSVGPDICLQDDPLCAHPTGSNGDDNGHGTHVTGIAAADTNNGIGVAGLGWNTRAEMFQVLGSGGVGYGSDVATGIRDAVAAGDRVINMSLANDPCSQNPQNCGPDPDEQAAIQYAEANNVVVVVAAGNDYSSEPTYPGSYPGVLSVAASDNNGAIDNYSAFGSAANIAAPGNDVLSTWNDNNYLVLSGTSMAAPQVAAAAALVIAVNPNLSGPQVVNLLRSTAKPITGGNPINGGELDAGAAVRASAASLGTPVGTGYDEVGANGGLYDFGASPYYGSLAGTALNQPVVGMAQTPGSLGYWLVASDGGIFSYGNAGFYGSTGSLKLNKPIVGMATTHDGRGYWLVASDGGIFAYGDAGFYGSTGSLRLNKPVVGMASTPDGGGYWLVASDGGIFAFGDAAFYGSTGSLHLNKPVVGMASSPGGGGYWLVASDGGIFSYGDAGFYGSTGSLQLNKPIVGMAATSDGAGYWLAASDGGIFAYGDAAFEGSTGGQQLPAPVVGISS